MTLSKKYIYSSIAVILVAGIIFYIALIPKIYQHQVSVPYAMLKTGEQFTRPANLVKWYLPFAADDTSRRNVLENKSKYITTKDYSLAITEPSSASAILHSAYKDKVKEFLFTAVSDTADMDASNVTLIYKSTLFNHWRDKGGLEKNAIRSLENLKTYMEDTRQFYGYEIEQTTVADTSFLFRSATVPVSQKRAATKDLFDKLIEYAGKKNAGYTGTRIFYTTPYGKDQLMLFASIGVSNRVNTLPGEGFQYKKMPFGKNLLMATYQGPYGEVSKVYTALENFKADHRLSSMAIPYQKFLNDGYDFSDEQIVQMKVYYPVF